MQWLVGDTPQAFQIFNRVNLPKGQFSGQLLHTLVNETEKILPNPLSGVFYFWAWLSFWAGAGAATVSSNFRKKWKC